MRRKRRYPQLGLPIAAAIACAASVAAAAGSAPPEGVAKLAYVDPGSGSFILQALVATLAGAVVAVTTYWRRLKRFFGIGSRGEDEEDATGTRPGDD